MIYALLSTAALLLLLLVCTVTVNGEVLPYFNWDRTNNIFKRDFCGNGNHAHIYVDLYDRMNFVCPSAFLPVSAGMETVPRDLLYENLWIVTKAEFDNCEIDEAKVQAKESRLLMLCDEREFSKIKYYPFAFKPISGSMSALLFQPNSTYYFIATSSGNAASLQSRKDGRCKTDNMKIAVTVCGGHSCHDCPNLCCVKPTTQPLTASTLPLATEPLQPLTEKVPMRGNGGADKASPKPLQPVIPPVRGDSARAPSSKVPVMPGNTVERGNLHLKEKETGQTLPTAQAVESNAIAGKSTGKNPNLIKNPYFTFTMGVVCGSIFVFILFQLVRKLRQRRSRSKARQATETRSDKTAKLHCELQPQDMQPRDLCTQANTSNKPEYKRLPSSRSTGSGGDSTPSCPDSPNGTLDRNPSSFDHGQKNGYVPNGIPHSEFQDTRACYNGKGEYAILQSSCRMASDGLSSPSDPDSPNGTLEFTSRFFPASNGKRGGHGTKVPQRQERQNLFVDV